MKKEMILLGIAFVSLGLILGCTTATETATTTTTTSTTTTTLSAGATAGSAAQSAVKAAVGTAQTSQTTGNMAGSEPTGYSVQSINAQEQAPPDAFFSPLPSNGWITIEGVALTSGEVIQVRMYTKGGERIDGSFLSSKKIASMEGFNWQTMATGDFSFEAFSSAANSWLNHPTDWDPSNATKIANFYSSSTKYQNVSSLWDYIVWGYVSAHMEPALDGAYKIENLTLTGLSAYPNVGTPAATADDIFGTQEVHVTGTHLNGDSIDITQSVSTDATGKPVSATGSGTITRADGVVMTINSMTMTFSDGAPSSGTMDITVGTPDNLHIVMTMTATGAASGTVYSTATTPETQVGTVVIFAAPYDANGDGTVDDGYFEDSATGTKEYF